VAAALFGLYEQTFRDRMIRSEPPWRQLHVSLALEVLLEGAEKDGDL
jgi:hypothetical protein